MDQVISMIMRMALAVDSAGNVYVTGFSAGAGTSADYATIKYNSTGDTVWVRQYNAPGNGDDYTHALAVDGAGNVYVTGESSGHYATIKYSPAGDTLWVRRYNGPGNLDDYADALAVDGAGNVYVTGGSAGAGTSYDYATIKYNPAGDTLWVRRYNAPGNDYDEAYALAVDGSENVYVTGGSYGSDTYYDYATIKYCQTPGISETTTEPTSAKLIIGQNPVRGSAKIFYNLTGNEIATLRVFNVLGELVYSATTDQGFFTVKDLPAGVYLLHFEANSHKEHSKLVVVK